MNTALTTRRDFLAALTRTTAVGTLALQLPMLATLTGCADDAEQFVRLTPDEARTIRAFAAQILPSESGLPGANEAHVVNFVDHAFGDPFFASAVPVLRTGLAELDTHARSTGARHGFSALSDAEQKESIRRIVDTPFFVSARTIVLTGAFADSSYGGNHNGAGMTIMGMDHKPSYKAPFGWYDAQPSTARAESNP